MDFMKILDKLRDEQGGKGVSEGMRREKKRKPGHSPAIKIHGIELVQMPVRVKHGDG
jgi:hypothetical protein